MKYELDIQDDDIKISDFNEIESVIEQCNKDQFYPNVWHINDHGNVDLLSINFDTGEYKIVESWV